MKPVATQTRIQWIDIAKGYGTMLAILGHIGQGIPRLWIYTFHMPLFFFLSGYVFKDSYAFPEFIKRKCKAIVVPYFCLGIPMVFYEAFVTNGKGQMNWENFWELMLDLFLQRRLWTLWFIACLFCLNIIFYMIVKVCKKQWIIGTLSAALPVVGLVYYKFGGVSLPWNIDACMMAIPFFYVGYCMRRNSIKVDEVLNDKKRKWVLFSALLLVNLVCGVLSIDETWTGLEMFYSKYGNPVFTYMSAFAGVACMVILSKSFSCAPMRYLGENSMLYYAWHQTIMMPVVEGLLAFTGIAALVGSGTFVYKAIWLLGILGLTTICLWVFKKLGWKFMLGK